MFSTLSKRNFSFSVTFILSSANAFNLDQSEILSFGKELNLHHTIPTFKTWQMALTLYRTILTFNNPKEEGYRNIEGKGENAGNQRSEFTLATGLTS